MMKKRRSYWKMTTSELRRATRKYDKELVGTPGVPLTTEQKTALRRARRKRGRPRVGEGAINVLISIERKLLGRANQFAKKRGISRSQLIAQGLKAVMASGS